MSSFTFNAFIDGVHFDPKKAIVKIQLIAGSRISIDKLTTLGPGDETVRVTLESAQTILDVEQPTSLAGEEGGEEEDVGTKLIDRLEDAAKYLRTDGPKITAVEDEEEEDDDIEGGRGGVI